MYVFICTYSLLGSTIGCVNYLVNIGARKRCSPPWSFRGPKAKV